MKQIVPILFTALLAAGCSAFGGDTPTGAPQTIPPFMGTPETANGGEASPAPAIISAPAPDPTLIPGDLVAVTVFRQPDLSLEIRIPNSGKISFPLIGTVQAADVTPAGLEDTIRERLAKDYLNDPSVTVSVKEYAKRKVYILGAVVKPGGYETLPTEGLTILQLVAAAEGYTDRAYKEFVQLVRNKPEGGREVIRLSLSDVERAVSQGRAQADLALWPGDLVVIPSAARVVYVLGAVNKPGNFEIPTDTRMTLSMAVSMAGSYNKFASTGSIQVLRQPPGGKPKKFLVSLDEILAGSSDLDLQPGDVVWVPERTLF